MIASARATGAAERPEIAARLVDAWIELRTMRYQALRSLSDGQPVSASMSKLLWGPWHRRLGELAIDVRGADATVVEAPYTLDGDQALFLYTRADTIYAGSDEIQRNIISERMLGLPRS